MAVFMAYISDILLGAGALAAAFYCVVLSRKLNKFSGLDQELGGAIALLSQQVDEMTEVLKSAQEAADGARSELSQMTERAEVVAAQLQQASNIPTPAPSASDTGGLKDGAPSLFMRHSGTGAQ